MIYLEFGTDINVFTHHSLVQRQTFHFSFYNFQFGFLLQLSSQRHKHGCGCFSWPLPRRKLNKGLREDESNRGREAERDVILPQSIALHYPAVVTPYTIILYSFK